MDSPPPINQQQQQRPKQQQQQPQQQNVFAVDRDAVWMIRSLENPPRGGGTTKRFDTSTTLQGRRPLDVVVTGAGPQKNRLHDQMTNTDGITTTITTTATISTAAQQQQQHSLDTEQEIMDKIRNNAFSKRLQRDPLRRRPPFETVVENIKQNSIIGDPQFLLDFAIIGHVKCATSTMMHWLASHPETLLFPYEVPHLCRGKLGGFVKKLYYGLDNTVTVPTTAAVATAAALSPSLMARQTSSGINTTTMTSTTPTMITNNHSHNNYSHNYNNNNNNNVPFFINEGTNIPVTFKIYVPFGIYVPTFHVPN
jgi:hypothetical protein